MALYGGKKTRIGFEKEAEWGTNVGSLSSPIGMIQGTPTVTGDNQTVNVFAGGRINSRALLDGSFYCGAKIDYFMQNCTFATASIGDYDTTSPVTNTSNYTHLSGTKDSTSTIATPVEYEVVPYTLKFGVSGANKNITLTGCKSNSISFAIGLREPVRASVEVFAQKITTDTDIQTITEIPDEPYMYHRKGLLNIDDVANVNVTELNFTVTNSLKRSEGMSTDKFINALEQGDRAITGNISLNYDGTDTQIADALGGTTPLDSETVSIDMLVDNELTETLAAYRGIKFDMDTVKLGSLERAHPVDGDMISETYSFTAQDLILSDFNDTVSDLW